MRALDKSSMRLAVLAAITLLTAPVHSNPWMPTQVHNLINFEYRNYSASHRFPAHQFSTHTLPSNSRYLKQELRITGRTALSPSWLLFYDLRVAHIQKIKHKRTLLANSIEDQQIGFAHVFDNWPTYAQALAFSVVIPTGFGTGDSVLNTGQHAVELDYWLWARLGGAGSSDYISLSLGPRVFMEGGAPQLRVTGLVSGPLVRSWSWLGTVFLSRVLAPDGGYIPGDVAHNATNYNLLRPGVGVSYRLNRTVRFKLLYEQEVAGERLHAGHRISFSIGFRD